MPANTVTPPEFSRADQLALRSVATQFFINGAMLASFVPRLPEIRDRVDITVAQLGLILTASGAAGLLGSAVVGHLVERLGTRRLLTIAGLALAASLAMIGRAPNVVTLVIGLACFAISDIFVDVAMNLQASWLNVRRHSPVLNRLHGLWSLGTIAGGIMATRLASSGMSLQTHLSSLAVVFALVVVLVSRHLLRSDEHVNSEPPSNADTHRKSSKRPFVLLALAGACAIAMEQTSNDWAAFRLADDFDVAAGTAGVGFVGFTVGMTIGRLAGDWAQGKLGSDRLATVATALSGLGLAGASFAPTALLTVLSYGVAGLGIATFFPKLYNDAALAPGRSGLGLGYMTAGSRASALVVPTIVGTLAATSLSVGTATALVTLPAAGGMWILLSYTRRLREPGAN